MNLCYSPGACSLAPHISLREAAIPSDLRRVDPKTKQTASGGDFLEINAKGYVPALVLDDGRIVTENLAVLEYIAGLAPALGVVGSLGRTRPAEALAYIATELRKRGGTKEETSNAGAYITRRLDYVAETVAGDYPFGGWLCAADFYLFVMTRRAGRRFDVGVPARLQIHRDPVQGRPVVQAALSAEAADRMVHRWNSVVAPPPRMRQDSAE